MHTVYIIDYLGIHCGMHYYCEAFRKVLSDVPGISVELLSNFPSEPGRMPFFVNQYKGNILQKGISLLRNLRRLRKFVSSHPDGLFVYLTYGNIIDVPFMKIISASPAHLVDIHEVVAQKNDTSRWRRNVISRLYRNSVRAVISHSARTDEILKEFGYEGERLFVPHFKYLFPKSYDVAAVGEDLKGAFDSGRINVLFFGNLNRQKGIDVMLEAMNLLDDDAARSISLLVAGKDNDGAVDTVTVRPGRNVTVVRRHISDNELTFLYSNTDYVALPYRKTSQSGILEMAFYFRRPIIASDLPYFRKALTEFPSFGLLAGNTAESFANALAETARRHRSAAYYNENEYSRYENRAEIKAFTADFATWMANLKP